MVRAKLLGGIFVKKLLIGAVCLGLVSCGVVYNTPVVSDEDANIKVVAITPTSVRQANASRFTPKSLPAAFFQTASAGAQLRPVGGTVPQALLRPEERPNQVPMSLPPVPARQSYKIGVGDVVILSIPSSGQTVEQLSGLLAAQNSRQGYTVQDDGAIAIPDIGRVELAGLSIKEAEAEIFQALVANQFDPTFSIEIAEFNSKRVAIGGAVGAPKVVPVTLTGLTLEEVLVQAGGITLQDADFATIRIYREGVLYQIPLTEYLTRPELQKTPLVAGDSLFVDSAYDLDRAQAYFAEQISIAQLRQQRRDQAIAQLNTEIGLRQTALSELRSNFQARLSAGAVDQDYVYLTGEVNSSGRFALPFETRAKLADALFGSAGGFSTRNADAAQIYILRAQEESTAPVIAWNLDVRQAANLVLTTQFELRPNDIIFIAEQPITRWNRVLQQILPNISAAEQFGLVSTN